jgi:ABC-type multidrug transport system fused ATPase/permease subunit
MGLSDKEQEVLDQLERQLTGGKKPIKEVKPAAPVHYARLLISGALLFVIGLSILIFATSIHVTWLGVLAFLIMLTGLYFVSQKWSSKGIKSSKSPQAKPKTKENPFEKRWNQRD